MNYVQLEDGVRAFKLAVKELVARRALTVELIEVKGLLGRKRSESVLTRAPGAVSVTASSLVPVVDLYQRLTQGSPDLPVGGTEGHPVTMRKFARAARREFGGRLGKYRDPHVVGSLARRGLVQWRKDVSGLFTRTHWSWTDAGELADGELEQWLALGKENLRRWAWEDRSRAIAFARAAGTSILLMNELYGVDLGGLGNRLGERAAQAGHATEGIAFAATASSADESGAAWPDTEAQFAGGFDAPGALDFGAADFSALDGAFGAIDAELVFIGGGDGGGGGGDGGVG